VFSVKTERDVIFRHELEALQRRHSNLHVTITLTRTDNAEWSVERGRITPALLGRVVPQIAARRVHICGPTEMTDPIRQMLRDLGVPDSSVHVESFASPSRTATAAAPEELTDTRASLAEPPSAADEAEEATVTFARSGKTAPASAGQTVLEIAESLGVAINYDCRAGVCGQCKTKLLAGRVVMDAEDALDARDRANQIILSCQAHCIGQVVVEA
jgi:ferredoxin-NADP reductase